MPFRLRGFGILYRCLKPTGIQIQSSYTKVDVSTSESDLLLSSPELIELMIDGVQPLNDGQAAGNYLSLLVASPGN